MENNKILIRAFKIKQPIGDFYVGYANYKDIVEYCTTHVDECYDPYTAQQRILSERRVNFIREYLSYTRATFPTGIVLNAKKPIEYDAQKLELVVERCPGVFFIIDGQHRIEALKQYKGETFQICVVIFDRLTDELQSEVFTTINSEQKSVNNSVSLNLKGNDIVDTPEKIIRKVAIALNDQASSPFYKRIRISENSSTFSDVPSLSLSAFSRPLLKLIYDVKYNFRVKDELILNNNIRACLNHEPYRTDRIFWPYYVSSRERIIYLILLNYFTAVKDVFDNEWCNKRSLLSKTSGYNALVMLLEDIYKKSNRDMSDDAIFKLLLPLREKYKSGFSLENIGLGHAASFNLYKNFKKLLFLEDTKKITFDYENYEGEE